MAGKLERRDVLKLAGVVSAQAAVGCAVPSAESPPGDDHPPDPKNETWDVGKISGYPKWPSVKQGATLTLHVSTHAPAFRVDFYHQGETLALVGNSPWYPGAFAPVRRPDQDYAFPAVDFKIPEAWPSGCYIAFFVEGDSNHNPRWKPADATTTHGDGKAFFVVRNAGKPAAILYKIALATYQAYNYVGDANLYKKEKGPDGKDIDIFLDGKKQSPALPSGLCVTMLRPGHGAGYKPMTGAGPIDYYDLKTPMNCFEHLDAYLVRWLEANGYEVDYCVDTDLQVENDLFTPYQLVICAGHDEYWSEQQRAAHEEFVKGGGNIAFFTGNTCWWRIHYIRNNTAIVCDKRGGPALDQWYRIDPENKIIGVSYRHGGSCWQHKRKPLGYTVEVAEHWVFAGTGMKQGDKFGDGEDVSVVGVEVDGCPWTRINGVAVPRDHAKYGTPDNFQILATAEIPAEWPTHYGQGATLGVFSLPGGGTVFNCSTTDWNRCIHLDARVEKITRNVLDKLSKPVM